MRFFGARSRPKQITRAEAFGAYLEFMEGRGPMSFTFPPNVAGMDQICRDVEGIILHETRGMEGKTWRDRLYEFQRKRGTPWPRQLCADCPARKGQQQ
jgi:hypothetical protein